MVAEGLRRLPGIRFEQVTVPTGDALPRMDVPVFVGFASKGPIGTPVAVEDADGFTTAFGPDAVLAWDSGRGTEVRSHLGPCVRSFFANGGLRCWVLRIAMPPGGWQELGPEVFLDPDLRFVGVESLLAEADYLRYQAESPRSLDGIHAALSIEEATMIAVPDAMHVTTSLTPAAVHEEPLPDETPATPPEPGFHSCATAPGAIPDLDAHPLDDDPHAIDLEWTASAEASTTTEIEERFGAIDDPGEVIYAGVLRNLRLRGLSPGDRWFRARYKRAGLAGPWSDLVPVASAGAPAVQPATAAGHLTHSDVAAEGSAGLMEIQRAVLAICAARGDLFAVLSLPGHLRERETVAYMRALRSNPAGAEGNPVPSLPDRAWSYGAVYHPWVVGAATGGVSDVTVMPPDGAFCGIYARRAIGRGAWIAPANETLNGMVALAPRMARASWQSLQDAHVNVIRHEPRGFLAFSADTLSDDPDYRPINVRRLLILLRRYAFARGMTHAFEPNSGSFRRRVQADFEAMLGSLFTRGAFAGATPRSAYQVVTDDSINTAQSSDQGKFIVELRVAPSLPMRFLTVRLLHAADRALALVEA
jgi:hypothetical protein